MAASVAGKDMMSASSSYDGPTGCLKKLFDVWLNTKNNKTLNEPLVKSSFSWDFKLIFDTRILQIR